MYKCDLVFNEDYTGFLIMQHFLNNIGLLSLLLFMPLDAFSQDKAAGPVPFSLESNKEGDLGQEINENKPITLTADLLANMAAQLGLEPNSSHMRRIVDAYYRSREFQNNPDAAALENIDDDEVEDPLSPRVVIRHFRGKEGIPFPAKDDVPFPFKVTQEGMKQAFIDYFKVVNSAIEANTTPAKLPKCKVNETIRVETGYKETEKVDQLISDILFLDKADMPMDPDEVFGKRTMARPYNTKEANFEVLGAVGIGVDCLPFRWRVTRKYLFTDKGLNAYKNYDKDQFGTGEFSEFMKAKLGIKN
jgi:hypothetical protein